MPFNRPSLSAIIDRVSADIESRLPGADARLRRSNLAVLARAQAGGMHGLYGYVDNVARQVMPDTAEAEVLERHASIWGLARKGADAAMGSVVFTGASGMIIPAGVLLQRADGVEYETSAAGTITAGTATLSVIARTPGEAGNATAGTRLALAAQIIGVSSAATVAAGGLSRGTDVEADAALRARVLARIQQPPHGGADFDYAGWALEVPGVTRVWVSPLEMGAGTVTVRFVRDGDAGILPDSAEVAAVQAYIDARRPVTAEVFVVAPVALPVNITLSAEPDSAEVRAAIEAELADVFLRESVPGGTLLFSHLNEAVSLASGEHDHTITVPAGDVVADTGEMPTLGTISWA
ncbi:baseplate J/gp47 family protein [Luteimonas soli]|uniref:Baseplate J/gp47 family protein n=1 Tax=Luteimonas soli TaxID=1648966 RepID=A0ABV7XLR4_9GAMM